MMAVSARTMRELDRMASVDHISTSFLMENAGEAVFKNAVQLSRDPAKTRVAIICGKGNNGGDGFVAACKLKEGGYGTSVYLLGRGGDVKNEAADNLKSFIARGSQVNEINTDADIEHLRDALDHSLIIDALLGTGFSGSVTGTLKKLIDLLNSADIPILSVDVPSGLDSTTGEVNPVAIRARRTISFALPKKGFYKMSGPEHTGALVVVNIGFPDKLLKKAEEFENKICKTSQ